MSDEDRCRVASKQPPEPPLISDAEASEKLLPSRSSASPTGSSKGSTGDSNGNGAGKNGKLRMESGGLDEGRKSCPAVSVILAVLLSCFVAGFGVLAFLYVQAATGVGGWPAASAASQSLTAEALLASSMKPSCSSIDSSSLVAMANPGAEPCREFDEFACGGYSNSAGLGWRQSVRSAAGDRNRRIAELLEEALMAGNQEASASPSDGPSWQTALSNFSRICALANAEIPLDSLRREFANLDGRRFTPISIFCQRSISWGGRFTYERTLAHLAVHGMPIVLDVRLPDSDEELAGIGGDEGHLLPWILQPAESLLPADLSAARLVELVKSLFSLFDKGMPHLIAEQVAYFHGNVTQLQRQSKPDETTSRLEAVSFAEVAELFAGSSPSSSSNGWEKFRQGLLPEAAAWPEGRYTGLLVSRRQTLARLLSLTARLDSDVLAAYAFVNSLIRLRPFSEPIRHFFDSYRVAKQRVALLTSRNRPIGVVPRCLATAYQALPELVTKVFIDDQRIGGEAARAAAVYQHLAELLARNLSEASGVKQRQLEPALPAYLSRELHFINAYSGLSIVGQVEDSRQAGDVFLTSVLDARRFVRQSAFLMAVQLGRSGIGRGPPFEPADSVDPVEFADDFELQFPLVFQLPLLDSNRAEIRAARLGYLAARRLLARLNVGDGCRTRAAAVRAALGLLADPEGKIEFEGFTRTDGKWSLTAGQVFFLANAQLSCRKLARGTSGSPSPQARLLSKMSEFAASFGCQRVAMQADIEHNGCD